MTRPAADGSRVEAAEAGVHAEIDELHTGHQPEEHVTASDVATDPSAPARAVHHHHPPDPNTGVVRGTIGRGALLAGVVAGALTIVAVVMLALAVQGVG